MNEKIKSIFYKFGFLIHITFFFVILRVAKIGFDSPLFYAALINQIILIYLCFIHGIAFTMIRIIEVEKFIKNNINK
jgi:hypothetical protein